MIDEKDLQNDLTSENPENEDQNIVDEKEQKGLKKRLIKILIGFVISTIAYYICKIFDPFKNLQDNSEVQTNQMFTYIKYIMLVSSIISIIGIVLFILSKRNIKLKLSNDFLKKFIEIFEWIVILPICVAVSSFLFSFVFTITVVDGGSMQPTLYQDEQLVLTYDKDFERFDIVVIDVNVKVYLNLKSIYYGDEYETLYVKRIIGMPGDTINYIEEEGVTYLYVNGVKVEETFFKGNINNTYYESLNSAPFSFEHVCDITTEKCIDNDGTLVIPEGYYFVLGDNRSYSVDSRKMGLVREEDIIGVIKYRMTSFLKFEKVE